MFENYKIEEVIIDDEKGESAVMDLNEEIVYVDAQKSLRFFFEHTDMVYYLEVYLKDGQWFANRVEHSSGLDNVICNFCGSDDPWIDCEKLNEHLEETFTFITESEVFRDRVSKELPNVKKKAYQKSKVVGINELKLASIDIVTYDKPGIYHSYEGKRIKVDKGKEIVFVTKNFPSKKYNLVAYCIDDKWYPDKVEHRDGDFTHCPFCGDITVANSCDYLSERADKLFQFILNDEDFRFLALSEFPNAKEK